MAGIHETKQRFLRLGLDEVSLASGSAVYVVVSKLSGKVYVGSALDVSKRWELHRWHLEKGTHHNIHLQRAWAKYGADAFAFKVLEQVEPERLIEREQAWIDKLDAVGSGYNICPVAGSRLGVKASDATRARMSAAQSKRMAGAPAPTLATEAARIANTGRPRSAAAIAATAAANRVALTGRKLPKRHRVGIMVGLRLMYAEKRGDAALLAMRSLSVQRQKCAVGSV